VNEIKTYEKQEGVWRPRAWWIHWGKTKLHTTPGDGSSFHADPQLLPSHFVQFDQSWGVKRSSGLEGLWRGQSGGSVEVGGSWHAEDAPGDPSHHQWGRSWGAHRCAGWQTRLRRRRHQASGRMDPSPPGLGLWVGLQTGPGLHLRGRTCLLWSPAKAGVMTSPRSKSRLAFFSKGCAPEKRHTEEVNSHLCHCGTMIWGHQVRL